MLSPSKHIQSYAWSLYFHVWLDFEYAKHRVSIVIILEKSDIFTVRLNHITNIMMG